METCHSNMVRRRTPTLQYNNQSGQGEAMAELFAAAKKCIGMTATLINGYASGIFHLLYRVAPHLMLLDDKPYNTPSLFSREYGVTEYVSTTYEEGYAANRRTQKTHTREKVKPGVSPLVYSRFLMESAVFLSLSDMGKHLPDYEEIPIALPMSKAVAKEYKRLEQQFKQILRGDRKLATKVMPKFMALLTVYPDQPYDQDAILHPIEKTPIVEPQSLSSFDELNAKDERILELVQEKIALGERVLIYTSWVRIDTQKKLTKLLAENGIYADTLTVKVPPQGREAWVEGHVKKGLQVLITNPSLVETGLDLNDFTTLIYYNIGYNLFTLRQSSRRSWRINQTHPRVEVYFFYFTDTLQGRATKLMASKLAVASLIEGNFSDEGLAAMSDMDDMTSALAKELTLGIQDNVEDLSATFKKMAFVKSELYQDAAVKETVVMEPISVTPVIIAPPQVIEPIILNLVEIYEGAGTLRKKKKQVEGQLALFDLTG